MLLISQGLEEPGACQEPEAIGCAAAKAEHLGGLLVLKAGEKAQLDKGGCLWVVLLQLFQSLVDGQQLVHAVVRNEEVLVEFLALGAAASLVPLLATCPFDQDAAHGLGLGGEEVAAGVPVLFTGR